MTKINHKLFIILYKAGLNYEEMASAFNCTIHHMVNLKSTYRLTREILCMDCKKPFTAKISTRERCDKCKKIHAEQFYVRRNLRKTFNDLIINDPNKASDYLEETEQLEGKRFCVEAIGLELYDRIREVKQDV